MSLLSVDETITAHSNQANFDANLTPRFRGWNADQKRCRRL